MSKDVLGNTEPYRVSSLFSFERLLSQFCSLKTEYYITTNNQLIYRELE